MKKKLENDNENINNDIRNQILSLHIFIDYLIKKSDAEIKETITKKDDPLLIFMLPALSGLLLKPAGYIFFIIGVVCSVIPISLKIVLFLIYKSEIQDNKQLKELNDYILEIKEDTDSHFYESYVLTDYFKDNDYNMDKIKQMNEYLSEFDKDKPNLCFNEVGLKYNYRSLSENKLKELEDKKDNLSIKKENGFEVIIDKTLVDKSINQPLLPKYTQNPYLENIHISNLDLKPSVFNRESKKIKKNNGYTHIEVKIGKVKVLTIDMKK